MKTSNTYFLTEFRNRTRRNIDRLEQARRDADATAQADDWFSVVRDQEPARPGTHPADWIILTLAVVVALAYVSGWLS